jgi:hypothetical protein
MNIKENLDSKKKQKKNRMFFRNLTFFIFLIITNYSISLKTTEFCLNNACLHKDCKRFTICYGNKKKNIFFI